MFKLNIFDKKYPIATMQEHYVTYQETKGFSGHRWCWDKKCGIKSGTWGGHLSYLI